MSIHPSISLSAGRRHIVDLLNEQVDQSGYTVPESVSLNQLEKVVVTCSSEPPEAKYSPVLEKATQVTGPWREKRTKDGEQR